MTLEVRRLAPAQRPIVGVDLSRDLDDEVVRLIDAAWLANGVLVFADRRSATTRVRFANRFGIPGPPAAAPGTGVRDLQGGRGRGNLLAASSDRAQLVMLNWSWHTDSSCRPMPPRAPSCGRQVADEEWRYRLREPRRGVRRADRKARIDGRFARHSFGSSSRAGVPP
jgi:alpha-ketoglutarate-dependent taurine dioxygenase